MAKAVITGLSAFPSVDADDSLFMAVCSCGARASYCHLNQILISIACDCAALSLSHSLTLPSFFNRFPNLPMCVFRLRPTLFIQSDETSRPDGRWIIMSFIFKSTVLNSQQPNQFKYFAKLQSTHTCAMHRDILTLFTNMLKTLYCPHPADHIFMWSYSQTCLCPAAETVYVLQALPICSPVSEQPQ